MWERFCFYGMRGVLAVFMTEQLKMSDAAANLRYGAIQAFVYAMTFVGGFFADKVLGFRRSITWGGLLMITGSTVIALDPTKYFYFGTAISIIGTGFFKPNISGVVGLLYHDGDPRRDAGFSLFYSGINVGAFLGGILCFRLGNDYGWQWAFGSAAIAMAIGTAVFTFTKHTLEPLGHSPLESAAATPEERSSARTKIGAVYVGSLIAIPVIQLLVAKDTYTDAFMFTVGPAALLYFLWEMSRCTATEVRKLGGALIYIVFSIYFWAFFEQSGGSLSLVARNHVLAGSFAGYALDPNEVNNSSNSVFVILLAPLLGLLWVRLGKREPDTTVKFGLGFLFLGAAFYVFHSLIGTVDTAGKTSLAVFTLAWLVATVGELCLSPIGLSAMTKLSPKRLFGIVMGLWFLASSYGQYLAGLLGAGMVSPKDDATPLEKITAYTDGYKQLALYAVVCGVALFALAPVVRRLVRDDDRA
jgi:POT family proton-dependent oligopeptide transporter